MSDEQIKAGQVWVRILLPTIPFYCGDGSISTDDAWDKVVVKDMTPSAEHFVVGYISLSGCLDYMGDRWFLSHYERLE